MKVKSNFTFKLILLICSMISVVICFNSKATSFYDGVTWDVLPSYYRLDGTNGIRATLDNRQVGNIDYLIKIWIRPSRTTTDLANFNETIFDIQNSFRCSFQVGKLLVCQSQDSSNVLSLNVSSLESQMWIHIAVGGSSSQATSYLRVDYQDQLFRVVTSAYIPLKQNTNPWYAFLGINSQVQLGIQGDVREFYFAQSYQPHTQIANIKNQIFFWDRTQIAYYRLKDNSTISDSYRQLDGQMVFQNSSITAMFQRDNLPNDQCYPFTNQTFIPQLNIGVNDQTVPEFTLDSRYKRTTTTYAYTINIWMKVQRGIQTTTVQTQGRDTNYFIRMQDVFSLYFEDAHNIRIYFAAEKNIYEQWSQPIFFPHNQMANLQITIDRTSGYDARVYDLSGRLVTRVTESRYLYDQLPKGKVNLLNNFRGFIKSIMIYQNKQNLPVIMPTGPQGYINDNNLILYYKFDQSNFGGDLRTLYSLNNGQTITFKNTLSFTTNEWSESIPYSIPSTLGSIGQTQNLFDGLACNDNGSTTKTQNNVNSYISYQMQPIQQDLNQATIEFWCKRNNPQSVTNYLFQLYSTKTMKEYMNVYQDSTNQLLCQPFEIQRDSDTNTALYVGFSEVSYLYQGWQHIVCRFMSKLDVVGIYQNDQRYYYFYQTEIRNQNRKLPADTYTMYIGNRFNGIQGSGDTFFKEVRFWQIYRSNQDISRFLYEQIDPKNSPIMNYFRLQSGNDQITNFPGLDLSNTIAIKSGIIQESDLTQRICPLYSYYNIINDGCSLNPFNNLVVTYFADLLPNNQLQYSLRTDYSDVISPFAFENNTYLWTTANQPIQRNLSFIGGNPMLIFNQTFLLNDFPYQFRIVQMNSKKTFQADAQTTIIPVSCRYWADVVSKSPRRDFLIKQKQGETDISFTFGENLVPGTDCSRDTTFQTISQTVDWQINPASYNINNFTTTYIASTKQFQVIIPMSEQNKFPTGEYVNFIATIKWTSNTQPDQVSYLNVAYRIQFYIDIQPVIVVNQTRLLIGQNLKLDSSSSFFRNIDDPILKRKGISQRWECDEELKPFCSMQQYSKVLEINYDDFLQSGGNFKKYNFNLYVWRSRDRKESSFIMTSITIEYVALEVPSFTLSARGGRVTTSKDNYIEVDYKNYAGSAPYLLTQWSFTPNITSGIYLRSDNTQLFIKANSLQQNTNYTLIVESRIVLYINESLSTQTFNFITSSSPSNGTVSLSPTSGQFLTTKFSLSLNAWIVNQAPMVYSVWGTTYKNPSNLIDVSKGLIDGTTTFEFTLPKIDYLLINVLDQLGEVTIVNITVNITVDDSKYNEALSSALTNSDFSKQIDSLTVVAFSIFGTSYSKSNNDVKAIILNILLANVQSMVPSDSDLSVKLTKTSSLVSYLTNTQQTLNDTIYDTTYQILNQIQVKVPQAFQSQLSNEQFRKDYLMSLSNLVTYSFSKISGTIQTLPTNTTSRRLLQTVNSTSNSTNNSTNTQSNATLQNNTVVTQPRIAPLPSLRTIEQQKKMNLLFALKDAFQKGICQAVQLYESKIRIDSPQFNVLLERVQVVSNTSERTYYYPLDFQSNIVIPIGQIENQDRIQRAGLTSDICIIITYYNINPTLGYYFPNQTQYQKFVIEPQIFSNLGYQINFNNSLANVNEHFQIVFQNTTKTDQLLSVFRKNQTVCMSINNQLRNYTGMLWSPDSCTTTYSFTGNEINCQCSNLDSNLYALVTDRMRIFDGVEDYIYCLGGFCINLLDFKLVALAVIIPLILFMIILPIIAVKYDKSDYRDLKEDIHQIDNKLMRNIAIRKKIRIEELLYRKKVIYEFKNISQTSFGKIFDILTRNTHPLVGIFTRFDVTYKRLFRQMLLLYQISLICIISCIYFASNYREDAPEDGKRADSIDDIDTQRAFIVGAILSILTLPPANYFIRCCKPQFVPDDVDDDIQKQGGSSEEDFDNIQNSNKLKPKKVNDRYGEKNDNDSNEDLEQNDDEINKPVSAIDSCICCKVFLLVLSFLFCLLAILLIAIISTKVTYSQTSAIVISWIFALIVGWGILNFFRIFVNTLFTPYVVTNEMQNQMNNNGKVLSCCPSIVDALIISQDSREIIRDLIIVTSEATKTTNEDVQEYQRPSNQEATDQDKQSNGSKTSPQKKQNRQQRYKDDNETSKQATN